MRALSLSLSGHPRHFLRLEHLAEVLKHVHRQKEFISLHFGSASLQHFSRRIFKTRFAKTIRPLIDSLIQIGRESRGGRVLTPIGNNISDEKKFP